MSKRNSDSNYIPSRIEFLGKCLKETRRPKEKVAWIPELQIDLQGLEKAVKSLPRKEREAIEKYFGLTGGLNHSKPLFNRSIKDIAYTNMREAAITSLERLFELDYVVQYDSHLLNVINEMSEKVNKGSLTISNVDTIKYLLAFFIFVYNGPKMSFEEDPMTVDNSLNENLSWDEIVMVLELQKMFQPLPPHSVNLNLLIEFIDMLDLKDSIAVKKSVGLAVPKEFFISISDLQKGRAVKTAIDSEDIEPLKTLSKVRHFKERIFPCGSWDVSSELILGNLGNAVNIVPFLEQLNGIRKDWSRMENFKTKQLTLKTSEEVRTLSIYNIGGLKFTDPYEVMFLYLERYNLIADA